MKIKNVISSVKVNEMVEFKENELVTFIEWNTIYVNVSDLSEGMGIHKYMCPMNSNIGNREILFIHLWAKF